MSLDDSQQEDCTVYIEELKSDNPSLKLNAATKLPVIASVLGHNRIRDELVPYLIEIIEQMDNENQFLIKVAEGLYELKPYCKNIYQAHILIPPLKILASLDQPSVREKAVQSIQKLTEGLDNEFHQAYIYPLIIEMSDKKGPYSPRVSATCLLPSCYPHVREECQMQLQTVFRRLGVEENSPLVRRAVAENIQAYTRVVPKVITRKDVLEIWQKFIQDKIDIVKIKALQSSATVARFFKKDQVGDKIFKYFREVDPEKKSWRIRYALAEAVASLLPYLEKDLIKKDSVQIFQQLLKDNEGQVRSIAILKMPEVAQKLSQNQSFSIFFEYVQKASKDVSIHVKMALIEILPTYYATLDREKLKDNGIGLLMVLIKDENPSIRISLIQRIKDLNQIVGEQNTKQYLLPLIQNSLNDKKWRFKLAIAESIQGIFSSINFEKHRAFFDKITKTFLKDHYNAVREQTMNSIVQLKGVLGSQGAKQTIGELIKGLVNQGNYVYRITGIQFLGKAFQALEKSDYNQLFVSVCKTFENEKVPNVWITLFNIYPKIRGNLTGASRKQFQILMKNGKDIDDEDVQYFASVIQE